MTTVLSELTGNVWAFVRSDPALVRQLNQPGNWSTWQVGLQEAPRRDLAFEPRAPGTERRSFRRRRWLAP